MPAIQHSNESSLPQPTAYNFSHFRFSEPQSELQELLQIADRRSASMSKATGHFCRSGGRTPCHSPCRISSHQPGALLQPAFAGSFSSPTKAEDSSAILHWLSRLQTEFVQVPKGIQMSKKGGDTVKRFVIHYTTPLFPGRFGLGWHQISQSRLFCLASGLCCQQGALCVCSGVLAELLPLSPAQNRGSKLQWFPITAMLF